MTYASWCAPGKGEIPALNDIAKQYYKEIDFVILFWDTKKKVRKASTYYNRKITILYIDEKENIHDHIIELMKHSVGFPTSFFIDEDKKIIDVRRGVLHPYDEEFEVSFELNHNSFLKGIELLKKYKKEKGTLAEKFK
jgi:thiol-disulfide isomerase/thioredoxin